MSEGETGGYMNPRAEPKGYDISFHPRAWA